MQAGKLKFKMFIKAMFYKRKIALKFFGTLNLTTVCIFRSNNFQDLQTVHHELGHIQYQQAYKHQPQVNNVPILRSCLVVCGNKTIRFKESYYEFSSQFTAKSYAHDEDRLYGNFQEEDIELVQADILHPS